MTAPFQLFNPEGLYDPSANAYSHIAEVKAGTRLLFLAGQGGEDLSGALSPVFAEQARQALANVRTALAARGAGIGDVFKLTLLIVDHSAERLRDWVQVTDEVWEERMKPACTLIPVPRLALEGMLVEVEAVAVGQ
ncbi:RidA family protein [Pseudomonas putida CSV86]|uniref:RidA family protein n=1 Tax=Pseudomonas bharatica CSV86 TaxID=1005395 RepID=L1LV21_9PSED|nr:MULTISPECIES: RidA family protein [Pseudomonas]MDG9881957.1 RidA family protein [Pseudomonas sp. GD04058]NNJ17430.1 RidA family protein [Pseudomonas bharatica CSV86]